MRDNNHARKTVNVALKRRGLMPDNKTKWTVHGPHAPSMCYRVFVGWAWLNERGRSFRIGVAVYENWPVSEDKNVYTVKQVYDMEHGWRRKDLPSIKRL